MIKPTDENLALYESWSSSVTQSEVFFGDKVDKCYKCVVKQGHTLFVPTGKVLTSPPRPMVDAQSHGISFGSAPQAWTCLESSFAQSQR